MIVLPYHRAEHAAEWLLQASDCLVIRNGRGRIVEIRVQTILDRRSFAGFHVLDANRAAAAPGTDEGMRAFEQFLAGVSARTLNEQECRERDADSRR